MYLFTDENLLRWAAGGEGCPEGRHRDGRSRGDEVFKYLRG
jgi:hypothetical protein